MSKRVLALAAGCVALSFQPVYAELSWRQNGSPLDELILVPGESVTVQLYNDDPVARQYDVTMGNGASSVADITSVTPLELAGDLAYAVPGSPDWWYLHCAWHPSTPAPISVWGNHWDVTIEGIAPGSDTFSSGTTGDYSTLLVTVIPPCTHPVLTEAVSRKTHGAAGTFDIDVGVGDTECRSAQIGTANPSTLKIVAVFNIPVSLLGGSDVTTDNGYVNAVSQVSATSLEIDIADLGPNGPATGPFNTQVNLAFPGVACDDDPAYTCDSTLCIRVIVGDYDNNGRTNFTDFAKIKNEGWLNQIPIGPQMPRADFDCSGRLNFTDFARVKNAGLINRAAPACPEPPIGP